MSVDPNSQFDQTVLDLIEHSPVGAVPHTPAYQDALGRLSAAKKVYASADHKDGHVTARSLISLPHFHANNLELLMAGKIQPGELEGNGLIFDRYVHSLAAPLRPAAESRRAMVAGRPIHHRAKHGIVTAHDPVHTLFLVPGTGPHHGLPGNYLFGFVLQAAPDSPDWSLHLHDADDGAANYKAAGLPDALSKLQEVFDSAPFHMSELGDLGFH